MKKILILAIILFGSLIIGCSNVQTDYPSVVRWNGQNYFPSAETIPLTMIGKQIGTVKKQIKTMPKKDFESNVFTKGSKLFEVIDNDTSKVIAVFFNGEYRKAMIIETIVP